MSSTNNLHNFFEFDDQLTEAEFLRLRDSGFLRRRGNHYFFFTQDTQTAPNFLTRGHWITMDAELASRDMLPVGRTEPMLQQPGPIAGGAYQSGTLGSGVAFGSAIPSSSYTTQGDTTINLFEFDQPLSQSEFESLRGTGHLKRWGTRYYFCDNDRSRTFSTNGHWIVMDHDLATRNLRVVPSDEPLQLQQETFTATGIALAPEYSSAAEAAPTHTGADTSTTSTTFIAPSSYAGQSDIDRSSYIAQPPASFISGSDAGIAQGSGWTGTSSSSGSTGLSQVNQPVFNGIGLGVQHVPTSELAMNAAHASEKHAENADASAVSREGTVG